MEEDDLNAIAVENEKLINQLLEFTDEMETWLGFLKQRNKMNVTHTSIKTNPDI